MPFCQADSHAGAGKGLQAAQLGITAPVWYQLITHQRTRLADGEADTASKKAKGKTTDRALLRMLAAAWLAVAANAAVAAGRGTGASEGVGAGEAGPGHNPHLPRTSSKGSRNVQQVAICGQQLRWKQLFRRHGAGPGR